MEFWRIERLAHHHGLVRGKGKGFMRRTSTKRKWVG
jgi:hypothetical protein